MKHSYKDSGYKTRIQAKLAELSYALNPEMLYNLGLKEQETTVLGGQVWRVTKFYYTAHKQDCELCGHANLKRVFVIRCDDTQKELHIGSECATNYIDVDIVKGLCKVFDLEYNKIVNPIKFEKELEILNWVVSQKGIRDEVVCLRSYRASLINYGNPLSVIHKINSGKVVGKREKEVIEFWATIKQIRDDLNHVSSVMAIFDAMKAGQRDRYYDSLMSKRQMSA